MTSVETLDRINKRLNSFSQRIESNPSSNHEKRILYCEIELLAMEIEGLIADKILSPELNLQLAKMKTECDTYVSQVGNLERMDEYKQNILVNAILYIDMLLRLVAVWLFLAITGVLLAFPSILLRPLDFLLLRLGWLNPRYQISNICKCFIAQTFLKLAAVQLISDKGDVDDLFGKVSCIICFSHSSTLDAFALAAAIPVRHFSLAKNDLFLIPFFSWSLMAFGGIPVNRNNRDQAIQAIAKTARLARMGDCVTVAPEGTRSTTGHLLPFKKGPFYLWETLQQPIVPLVLLGPYDVCPPGHQIPVPGRMYAKFLSPIYPHEAASREDMSRMVRMRMLEGICNGPSDVGAPLTVWERTETVIYLVVFYAIVVATCVLLWLYVPLSATMEAEGITWWEVVLMVLGIIIAVTLLVYVYVMYIMYWVECLYEWFTCCFDNETPHSYASVSRGPPTEVTAISPLAGGNRYGTSNSILSQP